MRLLAAIVNYRSSRYLESSLRSLSEAGVTRVSVVDNFSSEAERLRVHEIAAAATADVIVVLENGNPGFGAGVNRAVAALNADDADLIWIVNPDAVVSRAAASSLSARLVGGQADIVSPLILTGPGSAPEVWFGGGIIDARRGRTVHLHLGEDPGGLSGLQQVTFVTGAAPMLTAKTFRALNGFREDLFLYWEDADFSRRATDAGLRLAVDLDAQVWHAVGGSGDAHGRSATYYRYMQRNRLIVASTWSSRSGLVFGAGAVETLKLLARPIKERTGKLGKIRAGAVGLIEGFRSAG